MFYEDGTNFEDDEDEEDEPEEFTESERIVSPLGVIKYSVYYDGEWVEYYEDPKWNYIYDEADSAIPCPNCGEDLRYHKKWCCCPNCDSQFSDKEITEYAGPWHLLS